MTYIALNIPTNPQLNILINIQLNVPTNVHGAIFRSTNGVRPCAAGVLVCLRDSQTR